MEPEHEFEIGREHKGLSVFDFIDAVAGPVDRKAVVSAARHGHIVVNGEPVQAGATLSLGDHVQIDTPVESLARATARVVQVLHHEGDLLIGTKSAGLAFDAGRRGGPYALAELAAAAGTDRRPRPVHRLDKQTSGLIVTATTGPFEQTLNEDLRSGRAHIEYLAVIRGEPAGSSGVIDVPVSSRSKADPRLMADPDHGQAARTRWEVEQRLTGFSVLRLWPLGGGRSHQVRIHLATAGHPALCDRLYGEDDRILLSQLKIDYRSKRGRPERPLLSRPALHAQRFVRGDLEVVAPVPEDLSVLLAQLRRLFPLS